MASVNQCTFIGNLTKDVDAKYMPNGEAVANVSIAVNENYKDKDGNKKESVEFVNLVFYRRLAEIASEYLKKGSSVYVQGKMKTRKWEKDGITRYTTEIVVNEMQMLGGKSGEHHEAEPATRPIQSKSSAPEPKGAFDNFNDDMPFADPFHKHGKLWRAM